MVRVLSQLLLLPRWAAGWTRFGLKRIETVGSLR
jgi:hypothetical protein